MTLSQRLTRAGLTFILFGTVAATLPQQSGAALADNACVSNGHTYQINQAGNTSTSTIYHQAVGSSGIYSATFDVATNVQGSINGAPTGTSTVLPTPGNPVTVATPASSDSAALTALYTFGSMHL